MDFSIYDNGEVDASGWYLGDADDVVQHGWERKPAIRGGKVGVRSTVRISRWARDRR